MGTIIEGSGDLQVSVAETEILSGEYRDFELYNDEDCHISINGGAYIFIRANQGIAVPIIRSLKFEEDDKSFNWIGTKA